MANEKRLIDAVRFRNVLDRYANAPHITIQYSQLSKCMRMAIDTCIELLDMHRAVDAVEVVRCKDCRFWSDGVAGCTDHVKVCKIGFYMIHENGYCVHGERESDAKL